MKTLRQMFVSYSENENLSGYSPDEFADRMMRAVDHILIKDLRKFAKSLQSSDTSGRVGNSVRDKRTAYLRGQALQAIRIGNELEEILNKKLRER